MASSAQQSFTPPGSSLSARIEFLTRVGALFIGSVYFAGFITITVHHAQFGIGEINLFKARALSAGILFALLTALPVFLAARISGYAGLHSQSGFVISTEPPHENLSDIIVAIAMYMPCYGLSYSTMILFEDKWPNLAPWWAHVAFWAGALALPIISPFTKKYPYKCIAALLVAVVALGLGVYRIDGGAVWSRTLWFYACALLTKWAKPYLRDSSRWRSFEFERWIGVLLLLIVYFSTFVYGHARFRFGGGAPVPIRLYLVTDAPNLFHDNPASALLIEETENGFYVLRTANDTVALFAPRSIIRALEFNVKSEGN
jgi:hypothetical protein